MFRSIIFANSPKWISVRYSSNDRRAATMKYINFANKALYGKVVAKKPAVSIPEPANGNTGKQSEMYWMLQYNSQDERNQCRTDEIREGHKRRSSRNQSLAEINGELQGKVPDTKIEQTSDSNEKLVEPQNAQRKMRKSRKPPRDPNDLTQFAEMICKIPLKPQPVFAGPKKRDRLRDILTVPAFGLTNWKPAEKLTQIVGGGERLDVGQMPSVGKVLQATMPDGARRALMQWKLQKIAELGDEGFNELQKSNLSSGSNFHSALQTYFQNKQLPAVDSPVANLFTSLERTMQRIDHNPELIEAPIVHPMLQYKGIVDCVTKVNNKLSVVEWKKSDRTKPTITATFDAPLQLCAYLGAINADPRYSLLDEIRSGLVVVAYPSGGPANAFRLHESDVQTYWRAWLRRLHEYFVRHRDGTLPEPI